ncbi:unnamed protein product [Adineta steineri]|uniref:Uncharacterized protein n=1 Tax=Adineta steineri TaxID=433720 RepID=A0A814RMH3_9BILA|nr:unnamed protein product [Adineta steineri]CAF1523184.1 unnamed protein product [Adineta steineri]CAF3547574.1 unnamed protein product [Adineta steineri]CAF3727594.1 unnamed protein product [Adineta steineri]
MNILHLLIFISILLTTNAQWYIKKNNRPKLMNYPNPGKRSLLEDDESALIDIDCSKSYSQLYSSEERYAWISICGHRTLPLEFNEDSLSNDFDSSEDELSSVETAFHLAVKRSSYVAPPYFKDDNISFKKYMMQRLRRMINNK